MGELFSRLKRLANKKGEVIITGEKDGDAFVIMSLDRYEDLTDEMDFCPEDCDCADDDFDFSLPSPSFTESIEDAGDAGFPSVFTEKKPEDKEIDDKELMKRVNEDIAKWREEQDKSEEHKNIKTQEQKEGDSSIPVNIEKEEDKVENVLTEEERYYLEPLE